VKSCLVVLLFVVLAAAGGNAQTRIDPGQLATRPEAGAPPETATFFPDWGQTTFYLAPGTNNRQVVKVEVYLNGLLMSDTAAPNFVADYTPNPERTVIYFEPGLYAWLGTRQRDVVRVLYWVR
jgi:hypothetical protein